MREKLTVPVLRAHKGKDNRRSSAVIQTGSVLCITAGITGLFLTLSGVPVRFLTLGPAMLLAAAVSALDQKMEGRSYGGMLGLLAAAALFFLSVSGVIRSVRGFADRLRSMWNQVFGTFYEVSGGTGPSEADIQRTGMVLALLAAVLVWELVRRKSRAGLTLAVYAPLCFALLLPIRMPPWIPALLCAGWLAAWCCGSGQSGGRWAVCVLAVCAGALPGIWPAAGSAAQWEQTAQSFRAHVREGTETVRFGEDSLPEGNLLRANRMCAGTANRLELQTDEACTLYLRGFVGSRFEDNAWKPLQADSYAGEYTGMLSWLEEQGFHAGMQYEEHQNACLGQDREERPVRVSVTNTGASRRYVYPPETVSVCPETSGTWKQDWSMEASGWFGEDAYTFVCWGNQENAEIQVPEEEFLRTETGREETERFLQAERVYRSFVYDHYLDLAGEHRELLRVLFFQGDGWEDDAGLYTVTSRIRTVLGILAEYKQTPGRLPADRDFPGWFLQEGKEGNAAYFAAAAVLAYRTAGIPARYAEGYLLTREQAKEAQGDTIILTEQNAHAWVEVYVDGVGWRTIEVTPGFYEERYEADVVVAVPNEDLKGGGSETAGIVQQEEYGFLEEQEETAEPVPSKKEGRLLPVLAPVLLLLLLLAAILFRLREFYRMFRYRNMNNTERMFFLCAEIMKNMRRLYPDFRPDQPLKLSGEGGLFDRELYERTIRRMEKMIYGQTEPKAREVLAAELLAAELRAAGRRRRGGRDNFLF